MKNKILKTLFVSSILIAIIVVCTIETNPIICGLIFLVSITYIFLFIEANNLWEKGVKKNETTKKVNKRAKRYIAQYRA